MAVSRRRFLQWTALGASGSALMSLGAGGCASTGGPGQGGAPGTGGAGGVEGQGRAQGMSILILGGTKFLGPALVERARERGHEVTLFNRGKTNPHLFPKLEKLRGDRDGDLEALVGRSWDAVVDTSGYVPRHVRDSATLLADKVRQYVFISSVSVYRDFARVGVDEEYPVATLDDESVEEVTGATYGALKALCEGAAEAAMPGRVTNIRPGLIVGPRDPTDRFTYWPVRVARGGEVLAPGTGEDHTQFIDVRDLAAWIIHTVEAEHVGVFNALGPAEPLTMGAFLQGCKRITGSDARFAWADAAFLEEHGVAPWSHMPMWVPPDGDSVGFASVRADRARARGLVFRTLDETIEATLAWFREEPEARERKLRAGLAAARESEVLAALHARAAQGLVTAPRT